MALFIYMYMLGRTRPPTTSHSQTPTRKRLQEITSSSQTIPKSLSLSWHSRRRTSAVILLDHFLGRRIRDGNQPPTQQFSTTTTCWIVASTGTTWRPRNFVFFIWRENGKDEFGPSSTNQAENSGLCSWTTRTSFYDSPIGHSATLCWWLPICFTTTDSNA